MKRRTEAETRKHVVKRSRPHLGTYVAISIAGLPDAETAAAIERGFAAIADIHRLMSFHEADSDVSRINRARPGEEITVDPRTLVVLELAAALSGDSGGVFDVTVAPGLVERGFLPPPDGARAPDPAATWRDVALLPSGHVRLDRPLWIDLGGIAKGYAVDQAMRAMDLRLDIQCSVNAGGDLKISGPDAERVLLRAPAEGDDVPILEIENAALASSGADAGYHLDGASRRAVGTDAFVSVVAEDCAIADALTKVVLALGPRAEPILKRRNATAYLNDGRSGWQTIGVLH